MPYTDHYSTNKIKRPYYRYLFDRFIFFTGTIGTITLMSISAFFYISSLETLNGKRSLDNSTDRLSQIYQNTFHEVADKISDSELIKESVEFHKKIAREAEISPELFLQPLSTVFSQKRFDIIALQSLSWNKTHGLELEQLRQEIWRKTTPNISTTDEYPFNENEIDDKSPVVTLTGKINRQNLNYRETVSIMESFVKSLNSIKEVEQLLVVRTPVDIRITSRFSDQSGLNSTIKTANSDADTYEILLLLQPSQPKLVEEIIVYDQ